MRIIDASQKHAAWFYDFGDGSAAFHYKVRRLFDDRCFDYSVVPVIAFEAILSFDNLFFDDSIFLCRCCTSDNRDSFPAALPDLQAQARKTPRVQSLQQPGGSMLLRRGFSEMHPVS